MTFEPIQPAPGSLRVGLRQVNGVPYMGSRLYGPYTSPNDLPAKFDRHRDYVDAEAPRSRPFFLLSDSDDSVSIVGDRRQHRERRADPSSARRQEDRDLEAHRLGAIEDSRKLLEDANRERAHMAFFVGFGIGMIAMYFFAVWAAR